MANGNGNGLGGILDTSEPYTDPLANQLMPASAIQSGPVVADAAVSPQQFAIVGDWNSPYNRLPSRSALSGAATQPPAMPGADQPMGHAGEMSALQSRINFALRHGATPGDVADQQRMLDAMRSGQMWAAQPTNRLAPPASPESITVPAEREAVPDEAAAFRGMPGPIDATTGAPTPLVPPNTASANPPNAPASTPPTPTPPAAPPTAPATSPAVLQQQAEAAAGRSADWGGSIWADLGLPQQTFGGQAVGAAGTGTPGAPATASGKTIPGVNVPDKIAPTLNYWADYYGLDRNIFAKMIHHESGFDPNIAGSSGEIGLGQLMPETAAHLGVTDRSDINQNLRGSAQYLREMLDNPRSGGDYRKALMLYNSGPGGHFRNSGYANAILGTGDETYTATAGAPAPTAGPRVVTLTGGQPPETGSRRPDVTYGAPVVAPSVASVNNALLPPARTVDTAEWRPSPPNAAAGNAMNDKMAKLQQFALMMSLIRGFNQGVQIRPVQYDPWAAVRGRTGGEERAPAYAGVSTGTGSFLGAGTSPF